MRIKIKCKKCGFETTVDVQPASGACMKPDKKAKGLKVDWSKDDLDKIMESSRGASLDDLGKIGIKIPPDEYLDATERQKLRRFIRNNLRICKELRRKEGEKAKLGTDPWNYGDPMGEINFPSSEVASLGIDDLRMLPGVTLKKDTYVTTKGADIEKVKGVKFITFLDVSGSMFDGSSVHSKMKKAITLCKETYEMCKKLHFDYYLALFTDSGTRVPQDEIENFFKDQSNYRMGGGTSLTEGMNLFTMQEYKDANCMFISDMELGDVSETIQKIKEISQVTNSYRIILVKPGNYPVNEHELKEIKSWFPNEKVDVLECNTKGELKSAEGKKP